MDYIIFIIFFIILLVLILCFKLHLKLKNKVGGLASDQEDILRPLRTQIALFQNIDKNRSDAKELIQFKITELESKIFEQKPILLTSKDKAGIEKIISGLENELRKFTNLLDKLDYYYLEDGNVDIEKNLQRLSAINASREKEKEKEEEKLRRKSTREEEARAKSPLYYDFQKMNKVDKIRYLITTTDINKLETELLAILKPKVENQIDIQLIQAICHDNITPSEFMQLYDIRQQIIDPATSEVNYKLYNMNLILLISKFLKTLTRVSKKEFYDMVKFLISEEELDEDYLIDWFITRLEVFLYENYYDIATIIIKETIKIDITLEEFIQKTKKPFGNKNISYSSLITMSDIIENADGKITARRMKYAALLATPGYNIIPDLETTYYDNLKYMNEISEKEAEISILQSKIKSIDKF